jgi:hypothetical protein
MRTARATLFSAFVTCAIGASAQATPCIQNGVVQKTATGVCTMTANHNGPIRITGNDITLDCAWKTIQGTGSGTGVTVIGSSTSSRIMRANVRNCIIRGFVNGVEVANGANVDITVSDIVNNSLHGIWFRSTINSGSGDNLTADNGQAGQTKETQKGVGVKLGGSLAQGVDNIWHNYGISRGNGTDGIEGDWAKNCRIFRNEFSQNFANGMEFDRSDGMLINNNFADGNGRNSFDNGRHGMSFDGCKNNQLWENQSNNNNKRGLQFENAKQESGADEIARTSEGNKFSSHRSCNNLEGNKTEGATGTFLPCP